MLETFINPLSYTFSLTIKVGTFEYPKRYSENLWDSRLYERFVYNLKTGEFEE